MRRVLAILAITVLGACAPQSGDRAPTKPPPIVVSSGVLVDSQGMTLYTYGKDVRGSGRSECNGQCAFMWPPLQAADDAKPRGDFNLISREGGVMQWTYKGKPLYLFSGDVNPGDNTGNGVNGVWRIATP